MDDQLQQLIELQKEQNQLLNRYLWRFRFSLLSLLLLTTFTAVGLGVVVYQTRPPKGAVPFAPRRIAIPPMSYPAPTGPAVPVGDINLRPSIPGES